MKIKKLNINLKRRIKKVSLKEENGQISAEMILLMGLIVLIVILVSNFAYDFNKTIADSISNLIEKSRNITLNKI